MTLNQAKSVNANANTFEYFETHVALNDERFELAA
jgi:hypothetical protein